MAEPTRHRITVDVDVNERDVQQIRNLQALIGSVTEALGEHEWEWSVLAERLAPGSGSPGEPNE